MSFKSAAAASTISLVHEKINLRAKGLLSGLLDAQDERKYPMTLPICFALDFYVYNLDTLNDVRKMGRTAFEALSRRMRLHASACLAEASFQNTPF